MKTKISNLTVREIGEIQDNKNFFAYFTPDLQELVWFRLSVVL